MSSETVVQYLLVGVTTWAKVDFDVASLERSSSLDVIFVGIVGHPLEVRVEEDEGTHSNASVDQGSLTKSGEHLERALSFGVHLVHVLGEFEIEKGNFVVGKVRGQLN